MMFCRGHWRWVLPAREGKLDTWMKQTTQIISWCVVGWLLLATAWTASADTVYLVGGGSYRGRVRIEGDHVIVEIPEGLIRLDRDSVLRIEPGDDLSAELANRRARLSPKDADGHHKLGVWAMNNGLTAPARELFLSAVRIQPDFVPAQVAMGRVFVDGAWLDVEALQDSLARLVAGQLDTAALQIGRIALSGLLPPATRRAVLAHTATAARRLGYFSEAIDCYQELLTMLAPGDDEHMRTTAVIELLENTPGGLYMVEVSQLVRAMSPEQADLPERSGFYPLSVDGVMAVALRDRAMAFLARGQARMESAHSIVANEAARAAGGYREADEHFARADALVAGIARSYRVEVRRRLIQMHQTAAEAAALRVDQVVKTFNTRRPAEYRVKLRTAITLLDEVQKELEPILLLARPYPHEFSRVVAWINEDLAATRALRRTLEGEFEGLPGR